MLAHGRHVLGHNVLRPDAYLGPLLSYLGGDLEGQQRGEEVEEG